MHLRITGGPSARATTRLPDTSSRKRRLEARNNASFDLQDVDPGDYELVVSAPVFRELLIRANVSGDRTDVGAGCLARMHYRCEPIYGIR